MRRLVFEFEDLDVPGEEHGGAAADLTALEAYAQLVADGMGSAFPFRFGHVYTETDTMPSAGRFTLDKAKAEHWLQHAVAAHRAEAHDEDPPEDLEGPRPEGELPEIDHGWDPVSIGEETQVYLLVRGAVDGGIISRPEHSDLDFEYVADDDGGYYYFLIRVEDSRLKLASQSYEMRKLGERDARGIPAALAILDEAVWLANGALSSLDEFTARKASRIPLVQRATLAESPSGLAGATGDPQASTAGPGLAPGMPADAPDPAQLAGGPGDSHQQPAPVRPRGPRARGGRSPRQAPGSDGPVHGPRR